MLWSYFLVGIGKMTEKSLDEEICRIRGEIMKELDKTSADDNLDLDRLKIVIKDISLARNIYLMKFEQLSFKDRINYCLQIDFLDKLYNDSQEVERLERLKGLRAMADSYKIEKGRYK